MERIYRLQPEGFRKLRNRIIFTPVVTIALTVPVLYYFSRQQGGSDLSGNISLFIVLAMILVLVPVRVVRNYRKQRAVYFSYTIRLTELEIIREQEGAQTLVIPFTGVIQVIENKKGGLIVRGINPDEYIIIPADIEGYAEIAGRLRAVVSFSLPDTSIIRRYLPGAFVFSMFALFTLFGQAKNDTLFYISGALLLPMLLISIRYVWRHKAFSRFVLFVLFMVTLSVVFVMLSKLAGIVS